MDDIDINLIIGVIGFHIVYKTSSAYFAGKIISGYGCILQPFKNATLRQIVKLVALNSKIKARM